MPRDKYANKKGLDKFFHKYTGLILFTSISLVIVGSIIYTETQEFFFEDYTCPEIVRMVGEDRSFMSPPENIRFEELVKECTNEPFNPPP